MIFSSEFSVLPKKISAYFGADSPSYGKYVEYNRLMKYTEYQRLMYKSNLFIMQQAPFWHAIKPIIGLKKYQTTP